MSRIQQTSVLSEKTIYLELDRDEHPENYGETEERRFERRADVLPEIDVYVRDICKGDGVAWVEASHPSLESKFIFVRPHASSIESHRRLERNSMRLKLYIEEAHFRMRSPDIRRSEEFHLFADACVELQAEPRDYYKPDALCRDSLRNGDIENQLVQLIRAKSTHPEYVARVRRRKEQCTRNFKSASLFLEKAFQTFQKLWFIRLELEYKPAHRQVLNFHVPQKDLTRMWNLCRSKKYEPTFGVVVGYIRKLEFTSTKGFYWHLILLLDWSRMESGYPYAKNIGDYWSNQVTRGKGHYRYYESDAPELRAYGVGLIDRDQHLERSLLLMRGIGYLTGKDQYFRPSFKGLRSFQTSEISVAGK